MDVEYEATFPNINKDLLREKLRSVGAKLVRPEFLQKRVVFLLPSGHEIPGGWLRVRDEGNKITMSLKVINGKKIEDQKEIYLEVSDFDLAKSLLLSIGCTVKAYQETKRELWTFNGTHITLDEWPFLEPFCEIEGKSEKDVRDVSKTLGFDYSQAAFCSVDTLYHQKYGVSENIINNKTPLIIFNGENPFLKDGRG